jgi:anti-sigma B factor antagonist
MRKPAVCRRAQHGDIEPVWCPPPTTSRRPGTLARRLRGLYLPAGLRYMQQAMSARASSMAWYSANRWIASQGWSVEGTGLSTADRGGSMVITISGDLDIVTSPGLDELLTQAQATYRRIILDLGDVDFLDTSALAVIIGHWKQLESVGGTLALAGARYRYTKTLWITGLADKLTMYPNVDEGLQALARTADPADT